MNAWEGPPHDKQYNTLPVGDNCNHGWICEHRWKSIAGMVGFHAVVNGTLRVIHKTSIVETFPINYLSE